MRTEPMKTKILYKETLYNIFDEKLYELQDKRLGVYTMSELFYKTFTLSLNKSDAKNNIAKYFRRKSSLAYFPPALELSANRIL